VQYAEVRFNHALIKSRAEKMWLEPEPDCGPGVSADVAGMPAPFNQRIFSGDENNFFSDSHFQIPARRS
jgi:hypothetical protein